MLDKFVFIVISNLTNAFNLKKLKNYEKLKKQNEITESMNNSFINEFMTIAKSIQTEDNKNFEINSKKLKNDQYYVNHITEKITKQFDHYKTLNVIFKNQILEIYQMFRNKNKDDELENEKVGNEDLNEEIKYIKSSIESWSINIKQFDILYDSFHCLKSIVDKNAANSSWEDEFMKMRLHYEQQLQLFFDNEDFQPTPYLTNEEEKIYNRTQKKRIEIHADEVSKYKNEIKDLKSREENMKNEIYDLRKQEEIQKKDNKELKEKNEIAESIANKNVTNIRWKNEFIKMRLHYEQQLQLFFDDEDFQPTPYLTNEEEKIYNRTQKKRI